MSKSVLAYTVAIALLGANCGAASVAPVNPVASPTRTSDQKRPTTEKGSRTAAQQKISSQLLYEIYRLRGEAPPKDIPSGRSIVKLDENDRAFVDVRAVVTPTLERTIGVLGGTIVLTAGQYHSILAWIPLLKLEQLAGDEAVISIMPAPEATTRR
jgi:hypothetical protein